MKKLLSVLLCVLMLASIAIVPAAAADAPHFFFVANGQALATDVFSPEIGYEETTICLSTADLPDSYGYNVRLNAVESTIPVAITSIYGEILGADYGKELATNTIAVLTIPADLPYGTYVAVFDMEEYVGGYYVQTIQKCITINIPCDHANAIYQGGSSAGLFTQGFTGVHYCPDCETVLSLGDVIPSGIETSAIGQLFSGFSSLGLTLRNTIVGLMKFISVD